MKKEQKSLKFFHKETKSISTTTLRQMIKHLVYYLRALSFYIQHLQNVG